MKKVLVAEDESSIREFVVINLKRNGYDVVEAADGAQAIEKYKACNGDIDVAILDIICIVTLNQHISLTDCKCLVVDFLSEGYKLCRSIQTM